MKRLLLLALFLLFPSLAHAEPYEYSPEHCDFTITFPEKPYTQRRCEDGRQDRCYDLISYTQVYEINTTVNFRVICNPLQQDLYDQYNEDVMRKIVRAMTKQSIVDEYETSFRETEQYRQAGLVGQGQSGKWPTLFIAQLWASPSSILSVESELIGQQLDTADQLFADILRSVKLKVTKSEAQETSPKP